MNNELASIVMPVFNTERYLPDAIKCVQAQTYTNWELLAIDDGSNDRCADILSSYANEDVRIQPVFLLENHGVAYARNVGIKLAHGRYLCFLDSDDLWDMKKLEIQISYMKKNRHPFTFTSYRLIKEDGGFLNWIVPVPKIVTYEEVLYKTVIWTSTVCIDLNDVELPKMPLINGAEDTATWLTILKQTGYAEGINQVLSFYRQVPTSLSHKFKNRMGRMWTMYRHIEKFSCLKSMYYYVLWFCYIMKKRKFSR